MKNLIHSTVFLVTVLCSVKGAYEEVEYAQVGQTVALKPPQGDGQIQRYMYWNWNENDLVHRNAISGWGTPAEKWRNRVSVTDYTLTISKLEEDDFGTLTLSVLNENTRDRPKVYTCHLSRITVNMQFLSPLLAGESLTLDCKTETPPKNRNPEIYWLSPHGDKKRGSHVSIPKATSQHSGQWTCVVKSNQKESKAVVSVAVVDLSPASSSDQFTSKSSRLTIPCSLPSHVTWDQLKEKGVEEVQWLFSPKPASGDLPNGPKQKLFSLALDTLQWKKEESRDLEAVDVSKGDLSLTKRRGKEKDGGDYECIMKLKNATLRTTVHVKVLRIIASPGTNLTSGQQLNMSCSAGSALPSDMQLKLFAPDKSSHLHLKSDHNSTNVTIPAVSTEHGGKWRCELWQGDKQLTSEVITLKIEYKMSVWMLVIICSVVVIVLLLLILVFILYRRKQQRMRHPRHQLCRCKHPKPKGFYKT